MNPLAIELYKRYKVDIAADPLEFAVNNQHMNGGIAVDIWGRTNIDGIYAVGEASGTHGATRPGGSALNAGQVFGTRVAEHIGATGRAAALWSSDVADAAKAAISEVVDLFSTDSGVLWQAIRAQVQARMSDHSGILCAPTGVARALDAARTLNARIRVDGNAPSRKSEAAHVDHVPDQTMGLYLIKRGGADG